MTNKLHVFKASQTNDAALEVRAMTSSRNGCDFPGIKPDLVSEVRTC
ncbi:MAG: hypothetical protein AAFX90_06335 [Pseudomonadota bacterium]